MHYWFPGQWRRFFPYMPGILLTAPILRKFPGSSGEFFSMCPGFCRGLQFSGNFRAVAVGFFLYAQDFVHGSNPGEISGQWWQVFPYLPGILLPAPITRKFPGSGGKIFSICPKQEHIAKGRHSKRYKYLLLRLPF